MCLCAHKASVGRLWILKRVRLAFSILKSHVHDCGAKFLILKSMVDCRQSQAFTETDMKGGFYEATGIFENGCFNS